MIKGKDYIGVGCGAFILNEKNELFLMKRNSNCRNKADFWSIPGGGIKFGENPEEALKRETLEECGVEIEIKDFLCICNDLIKEEKQHWIAPQYLCEIIKGKTQNLEPHKFDEIGWFDLNNLPEKLTNPTIEGINAIKKQLINNSN